ncbi:CCDC90 family protein [Beijerinckia sp. L45]|uniref:CCDC90 family protein n=1 Tax=Beijerinckia sp. L45 TaxID=1641855 RepID=UPI001FF06887|nr:CCDC90 family protein [Beijerinckia sp. L45]
MALIVDTLRFSKLLQDKGHFSAAQADTLAKTIGTVGTETLATKTDIADMKVEIAAVKTELLKWIVGALGLQTLVIVGVVLTIAWSMAK